MDEDLLAQVRALKFLMKRLVAHEALSSGQEAAPAMIEAQLTAFLQSNELDTAGKAALQDIFDDAKQLAESELKAAG